jgi:predicted methyltransferase MtxX (methanogen marker protein 4)
MDLQELIDLADPGVTVGIGLTSGDPREREVSDTATFCSVRAYSDAATMLRDLEAGAISAAARGSLPSSPFLHALHSRLPGVISRRIALLRLPEGKPFLLGPVGVDEGGTLDAMRALVRDCRDFCSLLGWDPKIAVLSAGRPDDAVRSARIAGSIKRGERLASAEPDVRHYHILIEEAAEWSNCIIAPDGVTGNLIYRTLTHLGSGTSLGALYFPLSLHLADTSRAGTLEEYLGAIALANLTTTKS